MNVMPIMSTALGEGSQPLVKFLWLYDEDEYHRWMAWDDTKRAGLEMLFFYVPLKGFGQSPGDIVHKLRTRNAKRTQT